MFAIGGISREFTTKSGAHFDITLFKRGFIQLDSKSTQRPSWDEVKKAICYMVCTVWYAKRTSYPLLKLDTIYRYVGDKASEVFIERIDSMVGPQPVTRRQLFQCDHGGVCNFVATANDLMPLLVAEGDVRMVGVRGIETIIRRDTCDLAGMGVGEPKRVLIRRIGLPAETKEVRDNLILYGGWTTLTDFGSFIPPLKQSRI